MGPRFAEQESTASAQPPEAPKSHHCDKLYSPEDALHADAFQTSIFAPKGEFKERRCERSYTSSAIGRAGAFQESVKIVADHSREAVFKRMVAEALAKERLEGLYQAWSMWNARKRTEVPLDNRELAQLRRQAAAIARRHLAASVSSGSRAAVSEALEAADAVATFFPYAFQVTSSLEYAAARRRQEERESEEERAEGSDDEAVWL